MTRSEEQLRVGTEREAGRARLRKYVVTETSPRPCRCGARKSGSSASPSAPPTVADATAGPAISEEEHEVVLHAEEAVVETAVPRAGPP